QIEEAVMFVLRNIRLGAEIRGIRRVESYELPEDAIREMIINAHCHRNYNEPSSVQVAVYDDRLEVTSPGGLYKGLTLDKAIEGHSTLRNRIIANVFCQMGLIESWGTGLRRIKSAAEDFKLPPPRFIDSSIAFRVNLFRKTALDADQTSGKTSEELRNNFGETSEVSPQDHRNSEDSPQDHHNITEVSPQDHRNSENSPQDHRNITEVSPQDHRNAETSAQVHNKFKERIKLPSRQFKIISIIKSDTFVTLKAVSEQLGIPQRTIEYNIKQLRELGILNRKGGARKGYWEVKDLEIDFGY
uniref:ATP-binding protein n=1 Tax=Succinimonas sp. TaxID=1936151 RepID=UPI003868B4B6